jgi:hypothetical protein
MPDAVGSTRGNPDLAAIKAETVKMAKQLSQPLQKSYDMIVQAGMKLMWSDQTNQLMDQYLKGMQSPAEVPNHVAHLILKGIQIIIEQAKIKPDLADPFYAASMLASKYLMCDALEYVEAQVGIPVDRPLIDQTTKALTGGMFAMYGIDKAKMQTAVQHTEEVTRKGGAKPQQATQATPPPKPMPSEGNGLLNQA